MDFRRIFSHRKFLIFALILPLNFALSTVSNAAISDTEIQNLEHDFQKVTNNIYTVLSKKLNQCNSRTLSLKRLNIQLQKLTKQNKNVIGICLIQNHLTLIEKNIDSKEVFPIFQFLLNNNNFILANKLYAKVKNEGDKSLLSNYSFIYARYYLKRKKWNKVLFYIKGSYNDLTSQDANFARLITGIALQKTKKHRQAVKNYLKIPSQSKYYPEARLNIATAYIRQDWWTDAHIEINKIIKSKEIKKNKEMTNRLYLVLGYSLLRKEFYRDSREAFRNIEVDSIYFNKALLGIALTATNQEDYVGALNALTILKSKKSYDLSVDESHLLLPYTYEKLNQNMTASASYTDAQKYYQERIKNIRLLINKKQYKTSAKKIIKDNHYINLEKNIVDFSKYHPVSFLKNITQLDDLSDYVSYIKNKDLIRQHKTLVAKHNKLFSTMLDHIMDKRLAYLNSYMNQARFGLARLFDNSNTASN